jgi:hypothetical protein
MDHVYLIDNDGHLSYFEPPNTIIHQISKNKSKNSCLQRINRIGTCDWCLWAINSDFEVCLYVFLRERPIIVTESAYEYQVNLI